MRSLLQILLLRAAYLIRLIVGGMMTHLFQEMVTHQNPFLPDFPEKKITLKKNENWPVTSEKILSCPQYFINSI